MKPPSIKINGTVLTTSQALVLVDCMQFAKDRCQKSEAYAFDDVMKLLLTPSDRCINCGGKCTRPEDEYCCQGCRFQHNEVNQPQGVVTMPPRFNSWPSDKQLLFLERYGNKVGTLAEVTGMINAEGNIELSPKQLEDLIQKYHQNIKPPIDK